MQTEYTVSVQALGSTYTAHVGTVSRKVHIYRDGTLVGFGVWSSNQITNVFGDVVKSVHTELTKRLVEVMYG